MTNSALGRAQSTGEPAEGFGKRSTSTAKSRRWELDTRITVKALTVVATLVMVFGMLANFVIYQIAETPEADIARFMRRFDLGHEPSLPAWFSSQILLLDAFLLVLIGAIKRRLGEPFATHWLALGVIFVGLSIDESVMFHEMVDTVISRTVATSGFLALPWVLAGGAFAFLVLLAYAGFLRALPGRFSALFVLSGAIYVGGAVGMEMIAGYFIERHGVESIHHVIVQAIEESLEVAGATLFFYSLLEYWKHSFGTPGLDMTRIEQFAARRGD